MSMIEIIHLPISFILSYFIIKNMIPYLTKLKFGQFVRDDGPESHLKKTGTPTMGGIGFLIGIFLTAGIFFWVNKESLPILVMMIGFGTIGFLDDYIKVVKKRSLGLRAYQKLLGQLVLSIGFTVFLMMNLGTEIYIPFSSGSYLDLGWFFIPFSVIVILGTTNGVNLTDGIDGLATTVTIIVASVLTIGELWMGNGNISLSLAVIGGLGAFLIFNRYPAKLFMGDTGSLALGGFVVSMAMIQQNPLIIMMIGFVYLVETISVMLQVGYYKKTKKRLFLMAPIHHHYELKGLRELQIVSLFSVVTFIMGVIAIVSMF
ncbi:MAG: phospho-N-acetylmuramoyl-pentapeptide-transferase [Vallitaleaceae bacterium]|jgi:phospho-N-acetylmuramoyl-pentapeptide-transferase|nr:phospho-N-acetylmuramoyl-pentapeptide-transferase [Vallitaleaceae bacterium]